MEGKEKLNRWSLRNYLEYIFILIVRIIFWTIQLFFLWIPLKKDRLIIYSLKQHGYSCNLKYLTEYLKQEKQGHFEFLWIVKRQEDYELLCNRGITVAKLYSLKHVLYRMNAGIVVTNDDFYPMFIKRRSQIYINTWHGGINYKKIGYAGLEFDNPIQKLLFKMRNPCPDYFISGSASFTETTSESFGFPKSVFLECGLPRNDILWKPRDDKKISHIKSNLGIDLDTKVLLYAPTFRKGFNSPQEQLDYEKVRLCLKERFGGEWIILVRQHYFVKDNCMQDYEYVVDVSWYEDMQELILCSDCMISDYSSCMWDFILTGNPCFVFAPDSKVYRSSDRSFFIPMEKWPYPICEDIEELCKEILQFDNLVYETCIQNHKKNCGSFDRGVACETLANILLGN